MTRKPANKADALHERLRKKRVLFSGAVTFRADSVTLPNGKAATREFMDHHGAVAVLPVLPDGRIIFVRQYRYPVGEVTLEIPAGKLHSRSDAHLRRAKAELKEETGYTASRFSHLLDFWPTSAFSSELLKIYLASGLRPGAPSPDDDEFLRTEILPFEKAWRMARSGYIRDAKTLLALQAWKIRLLEKE